jgi:Raf kinase inhibitor-like YbhB/YbcL family protein
MYRSYFALLAVLCALALACGDDSSATSTSSSATTSVGGDGGATNVGGAGGVGGMGGSGGDVPFAVSSPAFDEGMAIPPAHACTGVNVSPQLDWVGAPSGTLSFAMILKDETLDFVHSAIWDIHGSAPGLPEGIEGYYAPSNVAGAWQCHAWNGVVGYSGPCPGEGNDHTYSYTVYALSVDSLPNVIPTMSSPTKVRNEVEMVAIESAVLTGTFAH